MDAHVLQTFWNQNLKKSRAYLLLVHKVYLNTLDQVWMFKVQKSP